MSVTYLMQYSVQYIIAPVFWVPPPTPTLPLIFFGWDEEKLRGLASLSMKTKKRTKQRGQSRIYMKFLCDFKLV